MTKRAPPVEAILFDFFGTLVRYSASRVSQGYRATHALLRDRGVALSYDEFLGAWVGASEDLDRWSQEHQREFAMSDVSARFCKRVAPEQAAADLVEALWRSYLGEWEQGISYISGVRDLIRALSARFRLGVVTNTHHASLITKHLDALGIHDRFDLVVTSIEHGRPKPHPSIFEHALARLGCAPSAALFVGDSFDADYLGARRAGMHAWLVDPGRSSDAPAEHIIDSVLDLRERCAAT